MVAREYSEYIFTDNRRPIESFDKALKRICKKLNIPYGAFTEGGFVLHYIRRNFGTKLVKVTDIKTGSELLGHSDISNTQICFDQ